MNYFEFELMCSHVKSFYTSLLDPRAVKFVDLDPTASNFHGIEVASTDQSRRHQKLPSKNFAAAVGKMRRVDELIEFWHQYQS